MFKYRSFNVNPPSLTERRSNMAYPTPDDEASSLEENEDNPFPNTGGEVRMRDIFNGLFHHRDSHSTDHLSVEVEHYIHDKSFRQRMIILSLSNSKLGIRIHLLRSIIFSIGCLLYLAEAIYYDHVTKEKIGVDLQEDCNFNIYTSEYQNGSFLRCFMLQLKTLIIVDGKPYGLWLCQLLLSLVVLFNAGLVIYIISDTLCRGFLKSLDFNLFLMLFIPSLYLITLLYPVILKDMFIPSFLYCWPAGQALRLAVIQYLQRNFHRVPNNFKIESIKLVIFLFSFIFTWVSVIHHIFRNDIQIDFFDTFWFIMVTMSTVGYGDYAPLAWPGKLLVILLIISAIVYLIPRLEELYQAFQIQKKLHNSVSVKQSGEKYILICSARLKPIVLRDFLTEFYSDPSHYGVHCVLLVEHELASTSQIYLSHPVWARRISVLIGSPLRLVDLRRARASSALSCFIHTERGSDPEAADQHTIMCAWSIKDFAPRCELYVQIIKPENRVHLGVADHIVVEGELKHALLANNSHCPGISTLVTLLLHTFKPEVNKCTNEDNIVYNHCAPCEVYDSLVGESLFFYHLVGKNFLYAAVVAFRKYHVTLIGVREVGETDLKLNPGVDYILGEKDTVFFIGFTREEYSKVRGPVNVRRTLWHACATWAIIAMATSGINPYEMEQKYSSEVKVEDNSDSKTDLSKDEVILPREDKVFYIGNNQSTDSLNVTPQATSWGSHVDECGISTAPPVSPDDQLKCDMMRGVQLLRFHSQLSTHSASIPVKVNLLHRDSLNPSFQRRGSEKSIHDQVSQASVSSDPVSLPPLLGPVSALGNQILLPPSVQSRESLKNDHPHDSLSSILSHSPLRSHKNIMGLSDVPEESILEKDMFGSSDSKTTDSTRVSFSLKDAEEGRVIHDNFSHQKKSSVPKQINDPGITKPVIATIIPIVHTTTTTTTNPPSSPSSPRSILSRSMSEGGLNETQKGVKDVPMNLQQSCGCVCDQSLLNTSTQSNHVAENSSPFLQRKSTIFRSLSRKISYVERGASVATKQDEIDSVLELELDDLSEQNELVNIEDGCCESSDESDSDASSTGNSSSSFDTSSSSSDDEVKNYSPPLIEVLNDHTDCHHTQNHASHHHHHGHYHHHHHHRPQYEKGTLPFPPYLGFEASKLHLLLHQRPRENVQLIPEDGTEVERGKVSMRDELVEHSSHSAAVIVYCNEVSDELYHFIMPLRAHYLHASLLKPLVIMVGKEPDNSFIETIAWLPLTYYLVGKLSSINNWLKAGVLLADSIVILCDTTVHQSEQEQEHMIDADHIMAVHKLSTLFPNINIVTDIHYRYNIRFMKYAVERSGGTKDLRRAIVRRGDHLMYLFLPPFAAGHAFCSSMLDTLLYQSHGKPYIIDLIRQLLGCKQVPGSGFLWKAPMTPELLCLQTYDRVFQRLVSTRKEIPLGIYRTCPVNTKGSRQQDKESERTKHFLKTKMNSLGIELEGKNNVDDENTQSYVLPNPPPKTVMRATDVILVLQCQHKPHVHPQHYATSQDRRPHEPDVKECKVDLGSSEEHTSQSTPPLLVKSCENNTLSTEDVRGGISKGDISKTIRVSPIKLGDKPITSPTETSSPIKKDKKGKRREGDQKKKHSFEGNRGLSTCFSDNLSCSLTQSSRSDPVGAYNKSTTLSAECCAGEASELNITRTPYKVQEVHYAGHNDPLVCDGSKGSVSIGRGNRGYDLGNSKCCIHLTDSNNEDFSEC